MAESKVSEVNKVFGIRLKNLRKRKHLLQRDLAEEIFVSITKIASYEQGIKEPTIEVLILLANYFDVTLDFLVNRQPIK